MQTQVARVCLHLLEKYPDMKPIILPVEEGEGAFTQAVQDKLNTNGITDLDDPKIRSKLAYYYSMMVTCDKTVHYRNILMNIPTMYTGQGTEEGEPVDGQEISLKVGYSWHPNTDPKEKAKSIIKY